MKQSGLMNQSAKYGFMVIFGNILVMFFICAVTYPVFNDARVLALFIVFALVGAVLLLIYYLSKMRALLRLAENQEAVSLQTLEQRFSGLARLTFLLNMILLCCLFLPMVVIMYFFLGYTNIHYHSFVFCINVFVIFFLGYRSMQTWYERTYPLGRFGLPVAVQGLRSKIESQVLPTVLLASVAIIALLFILLGRTQLAEIDHRVFDAISFINNADYAGTGKPLPGIIGEREGVVLTTDDAGAITYLDGRPFDIETGISRGNQPRYRFEAARGVFERSGGKIGKTEGVFEGDTALYFTGESADSRRVIVIFRDIVLYHSFYSGLFYAVAALFAINLVIAVAVRRKLSIISRSLDITIPAITGAARGDLTADITLIKSRDKLEDFVRRFIEFKGNIVDFMARARDISGNLMGLAGSVAESGTFIKNSSLAHAVLLEESTSLSDEVSEAFLDIAGSSEKQSSNIGKLEETISTLNESMEALSRDANNVIQSMGSVESSANDGAKLVESAIENIRTTEKLHEGMLGIVRVISDIADQVNLLSLNASIEAARAGEHGRGFAVVAEEISKLADSTSSNVKEIGAMIERVNAEIKRSAGVIGEMSETFAVIVRNIDTTGHMINGFIDTISLRAVEIYKIREAIASINAFAKELSDSTGVQRGNARSIADTIRMVDAGARELVELSERLSLSSSQMRDMALDLEEKLTQYKI